MKQHYQGLGHVAVLTNDIEESLAFYAKIGGETLDRGTITTPLGVKKLALLGIAGFTLEFIQPEAPMELKGGCLPHLAIQVDNLDAAIAAAEAAGITSWITPEKKVLPDLFGGVQNRFFTGPSGEEIELLQTSI